MSREAHGALCSKQPNCWWVALNQLACDITCFASVSAGRRFASIPRQAKAAPHKSSRFLIIMPARPSTRAEMAYQSGQQANVRAAGTSSVWRQGFTGLLILWVWWRPLDGLGELGSPRVCLHHMFNV